MQLLRDGTAGHDLLLAKKPAASVLQKAPPDPQLYSADVAFGQPDADALVQSFDSRLKWIQVSSSSITRYDNAHFRAWAAKNKIKVSNSARVYCEACAEHTLAFMLAQSRCLPRSLATRLAGGTGDWHQLRDDSVPLKGQAALIIGYGAIGARLVELLQPFGMSVIAVRRKARGDETVPVVTLDRLDEALSRPSDHVINILPDSQETRHFFNAERFAAIKPGAVFYNIGRGTTVDQGALLGALRSGHLKAAWLDVTDPEPLPDTHPLYQQPNCFITPHVAGGHRAESVTLVRHFLLNLERFVRGEALIDRVM